jgi:hypothetical protein
MMLRAILTGLVAAALVAGPASADGPRPNARFTVDMGSSELVLLPHVDEADFTAAEGRTLSIELHDVSADPDAIAAWRRNGPRTVSVEFLDGSGPHQRVVHELVGAWPSEVSISGLKAGASEVLYETLTITAGGLRRLP